MTAKPLRPIAHAVALPVAMLAPVAAQAAPVLAPIWGDHAIIQRDRPIVVEGSAQPGEVVSVQLGASGSATNEATGKADATGRFAITLPARSASAQPITLTLRGKDGPAAQLNDLLVGEVYLCSGQSNMEMQVERALDSWNQMQAANDGALRMVTIPNGVADKPDTAFAGPVAWRATTPQTVGAFSAACYYMLRDIRAKLRIPVGAIHSSWGGSASRPWLTPQAARAIYGDSEIALLARYGKDPLGALAQFSPRWEQWYAQTNGGAQPWRQPDSVNWAPVPTMTRWNDWAGTPLATNPVATVWLRKRITLTAQQAVGAARLDLGHLDDMDATFVNGVMVGNIYGPEVERHYALPTGLLHAGENEIALAVTNSWGDGGMVGDAGLRKLVTASGQHLPLAAGWLWSGPAKAVFPPRTPWDRQAGIGVMANRMIAPIGHFALGSVVWYQGESDVGTPGYDTRLAALFAGWRAQFGAQTRMLVVQLANFGAPQTGSMISPTALLRDEQRRAVAADANAALVTAIDLGERTDIHPANKKELGRRLALAATGEALPLPLAARHEGNGVRISLTGVGKGLAAWGGAPLGFELCGASDASCRLVPARVEGTSVVLAGDGAQATRVRYGWAESPTINLYDARQLPLPGFALPIAP
jgi:sialate O-acetylesterase